MALNDIDQRYEPQNTELFSSRFELNLFPSSLYSFHICINPMVKPHKTYI